MKVNRIRKIEELLQDMHSLSIDYLCEYFNVSKNTIRRDIAEMDKSGYIKKVYGGIVLNENEPAPQESVPEHNWVMNTTNLEEKKKIAEKSLKTVENAGFNCDIKVSADGTVKEDGNDVFSDLIDPSDDTIVIYGDARQIKATALENLVGKAYMNVLPMYISDIKDTM